MVAGERVEIGAIVDLGQHAANMMIAAHKAIPATAKPAPEPAPQPEPVAARRRSTTTAE
jgi:hypothetical protein